MVNKILYMLSGLTFTLYWTLF